MRGPWQSHTWGNPVEINKTWVIGGGLALGALVLIMRGGGGRVVSSYQGTLESMGVQSGALVAMHAQSVDLDKTIARSMVERSAIDAQRDTMREATVLSYLDSAAQRTADQTGLVVQSLTQMTMQRDELAAQLKAFEMQQMTERRGQQLDATSYRMAINAQKQTTLGLARFDYRTAVLDANTEKQLARMAGTNQITLQKLFASRDIKLTEMNNALQHYITQSNNAAAKFIADRQATTSEYIAKKQAQVAETVGEQQLIGNVIGSVVRAVAAYYTMGASEAGYAASGGYS